jgi:hypothetical protein
MLGGPLMAGGWMNYLAHPLFYRMQKNILPFTLMVPTQGGMQMVKNQPGSASPFFLSCVV